MNVAVNIFDHAEVHTNDKHIYIYTHKDAQKSYLFAIKLYSMHVSFMLTNTYNATFRKCLAAKNYNIYKKKRKYIDVCTNMNIKIQDVIYYKQLPTIFI